MRDTIHDRLATVHHTRAVATCRDTKRTTQATTAGASARAVAAAERRWPLEPQQTQLSFTETWPVRRCTPLFRGKTRSHRDLPLQLSGKINL